MSSCRLPIWHVLALNDPETKDYFDCNGQKILPYTFLLNQVNRIGICVIVRNMKVEFFLGLCGKSVKNGDYINFNTGIYFSHDLCIQTIISLLKMNIRFSFGKH